MGALIVVGLAGACGWALRQRQIDRLNRQREQETRQSLDYYSYVCGDVRRVRGWPAVITPQGHGGYPYLCERALVSAREMERAARDAWGNPLLCRLPGPVHKNGWDLYSFGPNGVDEHGQRDDILVGENVAAVASGPKR
jgi:hypothetical protein